MFERSVCPRWCVQRVVALPLMQTSPVLVAGSESLQRRRNRCRGGHNAAPMAGYRVLRFRNNEGFYGRTPRRDSSSTCGLPEVPIVNSNHRAPVGHGPENQKLLAESAHDAVATTVEVLVDDSDSYEDSSTNTSKHQSRPGGTAEGLADS